MPKSKKGARTEPPLAYHRAISLYVVAPDGEIATVEACPPGAFRVLMEVAAQTARKPEKAVASLRGLNYWELLSKWHALNVLAEYGASLHRCLHS